MPVTRFFLTVNMRKHSKTAVLNSLTSQDLRTLNTCPVLIHAVVNREIDREGLREHRVLLDTAPILESLATREEYRPRTSIEERHRQLKCFSDLAGFTSRRLSLVVNQVVFVLLMYSLLQWYWQRIRRPEFNPRITARALDPLRPTMSLILILYQGYVARLAPLADIFVIDTQGGAPCNLTSEPSSEVVPSWSRDGRWIYSASNRTGSGQVWKMPSTGGPAVQVTHQGGFAAFEPPDGRFL